MPIAAKDRYLYRIIRFDRFVQMLIDDEWHFSSPGVWEDPYEVRVTNSLSNAVFAQCWCREGVSDAMWRIYSPDKLSIRIRTTEQKLKLQLLKICAQQDIGLKISRVKYVNEILHLVRDQKAQFEAMQKPTFSSAVSHLFLKRPAFKHEAETRVLLFDSKQPIDSTAKFIKVKIPTRQVIDSVLVDPRAPEEFVAAYSFYIRDALKFPGSVKKSQLYRSDKIREA